MLLLFSLLTVLLPDPSECQTLSRQDTFRAEWKRRGTELARKEWMKDRRILFIADEGIADGIPAKMAGGVTELLREFSAESLFRVEMMSRSSLRLKNCTDAGVLNSRCFGESMTEARSSQRESELSRSIVFFITPSAIDLLPKEVSPGTSIGPPAGKASRYHGWVLMSEFWIIHDKDKYPGKANFLDHGRANTAQHELGHMFGLPHHDQLFNPGFKEATRCTECGHEGGGCSIPHFECLMECGASDDDWRHRKTFGKGFGLCEKCSEAFRAILGGLLER